MHITDASESLKEGLPWRATPEIWVISSKPQELSVYGGALFLCRLVLFLIATHISITSRCSIIVATNLGNYIVVTFKAVRTLNSTMTVYNPFSLKCLIFFLNPNGLAFT